MQTDLTPVEQSKVDQLVATTLAPDETVSATFKEHRRRLPFIQLFWPSRVGLCITRLVQDGEQFAKKSWAGVGLMVLAILLLGVATVMVIRDTHPLVTVVFFLVAMVVSYLTMFRALDGRAYVVTNQRLICVSLPANGVIGSIDLKKLTSVHLVEEKDGTTDLYLRLSTSDKSYALRGITDAQATKELLESIPQTC